MQLKDEGPTNRDKVGIDQIQTEECEMKYRSDLGLKGTTYLFKKKKKNHKTPPDTVAASSILFLHACKTWTIQHIKMKSQQFNYVP